MFIDHIRPVFRTVYEGSFAYLSRLPHCSLDISIKSKRCGLFGDLSIALNGIRFAEIEQLDCNISWDSRSLYFDPKAGDNVWDYLFKESSFKFGGAAGSLRIRAPYYSTAYGFIPYEGLSERESRSLAISKYCQPHSAIMHRVENYIEKNFTSKTLGVHYRGTDVAAGFEGRKVVSLANLEEAISGWLSQNEGGTIFLATDTQEAVERISNRFPNVVHYQDCLRSNNNMSVHGHYDDGSRDEGYRKCVDVLTDALLLAECCMLFANGSRVEWFATGRNPKLPVTAIT